MRGQGSKALAGFTLMELMIAATILVIALVGLIATYTGCFGLNETAGNTTVAMNGIQREMERVRNLPFSQIGAENGGSFEITGIADVDSEGIIEVDSNNPDLLVVTITVSWRQKANRIVGEDVNLNGVWDQASEDANGNGQYDSPAQVVTLISDR